MAGGDVPWELVGDASNIVVLGSQGRKLWAVTANGRLLVREPVRRDVPWKMLATAEQIVALAGAVGVLYGATRAGALLRRDPFVRPSG
jgi:hypothetical protein